MKIKIGIITLAIAGLLMLNIGLISAEEHTAASGTVSGIVADATTGDPIEGATVEVDDSDPVLSATTGANGAYQIDGVPAGDQRFTASALGYDTETVGADVLAAEVIPVGFTLQPILEDEDEGGEFVALRGDVGSATFSATGSVPRRGFVGTIASTVPVTATGTEAFFNLDTKQGPVVISFSERSLYSITKRPSQSPGVPMEGDRIAVLVALVGDDPVTNEALKIIVKPPRPTLPTLGAVVSVTTDENGLRTVGIMRRNGKVKEMQLGPDAELPEVGDLVTAFQGSGRGNNGAGANGPPVATGIVRAEAVRLRLEGFLDDLTGEDGELPPQALENRSQRVADIAALLEDHASIHLAVIQQLSQNANLPPQAAAGMLKGLQKAQDGFARANAKSQEAKNKTKPLKPVNGQNQGQGSRGNSES